MTYESGTSIIRQCDKSYQSDNSNTSTSPTGDTFSTNAVTPGRGGKTKYQGKYRYKKISTEQLRAKKLFSHCRTCKKYGYWDSDHNPDSSIKYNLSSNDSPPKNSTTGNDQNNSVGQTCQQNQLGSNNTNRNKNVLNFGLANLIQQNNFNTTTLENSNSTANQLGPLVDGGAPILLLVSMNFVFYALQLGYLL